jgi:eukaryotic-like serine/threonine-protein kinase
MNEDRWRQIKSLARVALACAPEERAAFFDKVCANDAGLRDGLESLIAYYTQAALQSPPTVLNAGVTQQLTDHRPEHWSHIEQLFQEAMELLPDQRAAFLARACAGNEALLREVESLIAYETRAPNFIAGAVGKVAADLGSRPRATEARPHIGPYKLIREIGHGGMGTVFLAVRNDDQYRKRVAIKLVRRGMDSEEILRRFRNERQILATLEHPNIARLLDGGTTEDGLPYFVMEHIEGQPIDRYCDSHRLTTSERLKLFRTVSAAVHYAHQNLIVHRDLKPGNILVTEAGTPKLLDFGIAKLLSPELFSEPDMQTATWERPMTPAYASPEQVRGETITTASDVYSLGVVLYELLTGHRPYRIKSASPAEVARVVCESEPERPSTAINRVEPVDERAGETTTITPKSVSRTRDGEPEKLRRRLRGDLDNIVLMAMRKEHHRRYASVEQFSEDIRRHLEGLPVIARKDTFGYRAEKFIQRNKAAVAAAAVIAVLLLGAVIITLVQSARVTRERDRAARERDKAERISAFLVDLFKVSDPSEAKGNTVKAREILDKGAAETGRQLEGQPGVQATLLDTMGQVYQSLGLYETAVPMLEKSLKLRRELYGGEHLEVAESLHHLAAVLYDKSDYAAAHQLYRDALRLRRKLLGQEHPAVAETLNGLGLLLSYQAEYAESEAVLREALEMRRKFFGEEHRDVAESLHNVGWALYQKGEVEQSERMVRQSLAMHRKLLGNDHPLVAADLNMIAFAKEKTGELAEMESLYREALAIRRRVYGNEHPQVAESLNNVAYVLNQAGKTTEAEPLYREALAIRRRTLGDNTQEVAQSLNNLARVLMQKDTLQEAEPLLREALAISRRVEGEEHPNTARSLHNVASLLHEKGDYLGAEPLFRQALALRRKKLPPGHSDLAATLVGLGRLLTDRGQPQEAEPMLREALEIRRKDFPDGHWRIAETESALGGCLAAQRRFIEAEPLLAQSYATLKAKRGDRDKTTQQALKRLANCYQGLGKPDKADQHRALIVR